MEVEREIDRVSELPEFIIHQILSCLNTKEAARTCVLSNKWLQSYSTIPNLNFDERYFNNSPEIEKNRYPFFNFVTNTLLRYRNMNLRIHKFQIMVFSVDYAPGYRLVDESLRMVFDNGVKEVDISVITGLKFAPYNLPLNIFDSTKMLTCLSVSQCKFPQNVATLSNSKCNAMIFPFLKTLRLVLAFIDDGMLQKLLSGCPFLEEIFFLGVKGLKTFRVRNVSKLKAISIQSSCKTIEIENAPSLCLVNCLGSVKRPCLLKVGSAPHLRRLELFLVSVGENSLKELVTKSPILEVLKISKCDELERIDIVSGSLKRVCLEDRSKLVEVKIDAPSLLQLDYNGPNVLSLSLNNTPDGLKTYIHISNYEVDHLSNAWFHQLREMLKGVKRGRVSFALLNQNQGITICAVLDHSANPLPPEQLMENFMPEINQSSSFFAVFLETLFSSSRPTMMYTILLMPFHADFIKFLASELISATRDSYCCSSDQSKCWRHYLKDTVVEFSEDSQKRWQPLPQDSLSEFTFCFKNFRFSLEWYANLNAQV